MMQHYARKFATQCKENRSRVIKFGFFVALSLMMLGAMMGVNTPNAAHAQAYTSNNVNDSSVVSTIHQVFGPYGSQAVRIATCESSLNPGAVNSIAIGGSHAAGLFQILYPSTWYTTSQAHASPYNVMANIRAAHDIFVRDGYSWREWQCRA